MPNPTDPRPADAANILPGAIITEHPDHPHQPGQWAITQVRRVSEDALIGDQRLVRLDYVCRDGAGVFVLDADTPVTARSAGPEWFMALSRGEQEAAICYLAGYAPDALGAAAAYVFGLRDYRAVARSSNRQAVTA